MKKYFVQVISVMLVAGLTPDPVTASSWNSYRYSAGVTPSAECFCFTSGALMLPVAGVVDALVPHAKIVATQSLPTFTHAIAPKFLLVSVSKVVPVSDPAAWIRHDAILMTAISGVLLVSVAVGTFFCYKSWKRNRGSIYTSNNTWDLVAIFLMIVAAIGGTLGVRAVDYFHDYDLTHQPMETKRFSINLSSLNHVAILDTEFYTYQQTDYNKAMMNFTDGIAIRMSLLQPQEIKAIYFSIPIKNFHGRAAIKTIHFGIHSSNEGWAVDSDGVEGLTFQSDSRSATLKFPFDGVMKGKILKETALETIFISVQYTHGISSSRRPEIILERVGPSQSSAFPGLTHLTFPAPIQNKEFAKAA